MKTQNPAAVVYRFIGIVRSCHVEASKTPIQPEYAAGCLGRAEIFPEFADGLRDLEGFSHVFLLYHFDRAGETRLMVKPFLQNIERGVFATRAPSRPNPIGLSLVTLTGREGNVLLLDGLDILDGTPLLDIKPYVSRFDNIRSSRNGWQDQVDEENAKKRGRRDFGVKEGGT